MTTNGMTELDIRIEQVDKMFCLLHRIRQDDCFNLLAQDIYKDVNAVIEHGVTSLNRGQRAR